MSQPTLTKTTLKTAEALAEHGFAYEGLDGAGHHVFADGNGGVVRIPSTPKADEKAVTRRAVAQAKREERRRTTASAQFTSWLREHFGIPVDGERDVEFSMTQIVKEFRDSLGTPIRVSSEAFEQAIRNDDGIERLRKGSGGSRHVTPALWRIRGPLFGVRRNNGEAAQPPTKIIAPTCGEAITVKGVGRVTCSKPLGHEGDHYDKYRSIHFGEEFRVVSTETEPLGVVEVVSTETTAEEPPPVGGEVSTETPDDVGPLTPEEREQVDAAYDMPDMPDDGAGDPEPEPETTREAAERLSTGLAAATGGLMLPPALVEALREHLSGDVQAEVDILRDALRDAHAHVSQALVVLDDAFSISIEPKQPRASRAARRTITGFRPKGGPLGGVRIERLKLVYGWAGAGKLPDRFTVHDVMPLVAEDGLDGSESAWANTLYAGWQNDVLGHHANGVYGVIPKGESDLA